jgi:hypothetical protein
MYVCPQWSEITVKNSWNQCCQSPICSHFTSLILLPASQCVKRLNEYKFFLWWTAQSDLKYHGYTVCPERETDVFKEDILSSLFVITSNTWAWTRTQKVSDSRFPCGRAIARAVSRWLPTVAARGSRLGMVKWDLWWTKWRWAGFLQVHVLRFPLPIFIPPNSLSSQPPGAVTIDRKWPTCRVDPVWTPPSTMRIKQKCFYVCTLLSRYTYQHHCYYL